MEYMLVQWPYAPMSAEELSLMEGETIRVLSGHDEEGWWVGERASGEVGVGVRRRTFEEEQ